jgi:hypothetical protein
MNLPQLQKIVALLPADARDILITSRTSVELFYTSENDTQPLGAVSIAQVPGKEGKRWLIRGAGGSGRRYPDRNE